MSRSGIAWSVIVLSGIATFAIRGSFLLLAHHLATVPPRIADALRMIPAAALAALVAPAVLHPGETFTPLGPRSLAALVALAVAWRTRNLLATIAVGMVTVVIFERFLP